MNIDICAKKYTTLRFSTANTCTNCTESTHYPKVLLKESCIDFFARRFTTFVRLNYSVSFTYTLD